MRYLLALIICLTSLGLFAQIPGRTGRPGGQVPSIGHLYGKIVDSKTTKALDGISVELVQSKFDTTSRKRKDTVIAGMFTDKKGDFSLENLPIFGNFKLKITGIGFKLVEKPIAFQMKPPQGGDYSSMLSAVDKDLGNIKLETDASVLQQVTVTGEKSMVQLGIDRKVFNVDKNIVSIGGTAVDVMRNVPSVSVDIDGNVTLRNNSPQIFVDGRPTTMTLDQIPADAIQSVEIITNPSAKFDASGGTSGILNIVLKKNRRAGYSGNIRAGIDSRAKVNAGGDINVRQGKINVFANANFGERKSIANGTTDRLTTLKSPYTHLHQEDKNTSLGYFAFGRLGFDYFLDNRNTISISGTAVRGRFTPETESNIWIDTLGGSPSQSFSQRNSNTTANFRNLGGMLGYKHNFPKDGKEFTADLNYNHSNNDNYNVVVSNTYSSMGGPLTRSYTQLQDGGGTNKFLIAQTDFTNPINDKSKIEMGARMQIRNVDSRNIINTLNPDGTVTRLDSLSSVYTNKDRVFAGYTTYSNQLKKIGYQLGLRIESSDYNGNVVRHIGGKDTTLSYSNSFPISLFPSVFLSEKLKNDQELQLNYTRRINRPNFFQLFPFIDFSDTLNLSQGNPDLKPEFTNSFEMSYQKLFKGNNSMLVSAYFKHTTNLITRYLKDTTLNGHPAFVSTFINANSSYVGGLEITVRNTLTKWWELNTNLNLFTSKINIVLPGIPKQDNIYSYFIKLSNTFRLPKNFTIQLSGDYISKTILPPGGSGGGGGGERGGRGGFFGQAQSTSQGYIRPNYGVDLAFRYEFLKEKRASLSLNVNDIFRTRRSDIHSESSAFVQDAFRRRDAQIFRLNFNWRFGKFDVSLFKRKNTKSEQENIQNGLQGVQQ